MSVGCLTHSPYAILEIPPNDLSPCHVGCISHHLPGLSRVELTRCRYPQSVCNSNTYTILKSSLMPQCSGQRAKGNGAYIDLLTLLSQHVKEESCAIFMFHS